MFAFLTFGFFGMVFASADPPEIAGNWTGPEWGQVVLEQEKPGRYRGGYTGPAGGASGVIRLRWSRIERRFNGTWKDSDDRFGELSLRLVNDEIRGAWTTSKDAKINPATPALADLQWVRDSHGHAHDGHTHDRESEQRSADPADAREAALKYLLPRDDGTKHPASWAAENIAMDRPAAVFPHVVPFEQGDTDFLEGDDITILEVRGTAKTFKPGNLYWILGTYELSTHDGAMLAAYVTAKRREDGIGPSIRAQHKDIERGIGTFTLLLPMRYEGWPHVSFYADGEGIGGNYFGTGDTVLDPMPWPKHSEQNVTMEDESAENAFPEF